MSWVIYKHTNKINGKIYIGQTKQDVDDRWRNGKGYEHNQYFANAIKKYGWNNFDHEIIQTNIASINEANLAEIKFIDFFRTYIGFDDCNGYNLTKGGDNHEHLGLPIAQIKTDSLEIINVFLTIRDAENKTGIDHSMISRCCYRDKKGITAGGFYWAFVDEFHSGNWSPKAKKVYNSNKEPDVFQLDDDFNIIRKFKSQMEASRIVGVSASNISNACNRKRGYIKPGGFYWCWGKDFKSFSPLIAKNLKPVVRIDMNDLSQIKIYQRISDAALDNKIDNSEIISRACNGRTISAAGYYWCYKSDYSTTWRPRKNNNIKPVICIENKKSFDSIQDASQFYGISASWIRKCCLDSGLTAGGFHWVYAEQFNDLFVPRERKTTGKKVICVELEKIFDSSVEAASVFGLDNSRISKCCKDYSRTSGGFHWAFYEDYTNGRFKVLPKKIGRHGMRIVKCIEMNKTFESVNDASRKTGIDAASIGRACLGKQSVAGGYHWKYVD